MLCSGSSISTLSVFQFLYLFHVSNEVRISPNLDMWFFIMFLIFWFKNHELFLNVWEDIIISLHHCPGVLLKQLLSYKVLLYISYAKRNENCFKFWYVIPYYVTFILVQTSSNFPVWLRRCSYFCELLSCSSVRVVPILQSVITCFICQTNSELIQIWICESLLCHLYFGLNITKFIYVIKV